MQNQSTQGNAFSRLIAKARYEWDLLRSEEQIEADEWLRQHLFIFDSDLFLLED